MKRSNKTRRSIGRLTFRMPRPARFATHEVVLIDLSVRGAGIRHHESILQNTKGMLRFRLERQAHEIPCRLARSRLELVKQGEQTLQIFRSALRFEAVTGSDADNEGLESIREAMRKRVERAVRRQQADAFGNPALMSGTDESSGAIPVDLLASWMETRHYVRCTLDRNGHWRSERVDSPDQPLNGFTVAAEEGETEIELLRKTWEAADENQRRLIRIFAELALSEPSDEKRGRYEP